MLGYEDITIYQFCQLFCLLKDFSSHYSVCIILIQKLKFNFQKILTEVTVDEPCIILPDEVSMDDLKLLIDFVYRGEIKFLISQISSLSKLAQMLGIPGLPGFTEVVKKNCIIHV